MTPEEKKYKAVVGRVVRSGPHGPYAVGHNTELGSITFSLNPDNNNWQEDEWPSPGTVVVLWDIRQKMAGWRAAKSRFFRPTDTDSVS